MSKNKRQVNTKVLLKRCLMCGLILYICYLALAQQFNFARLAKEEDKLDVRLEEARRENKELEEQKEAAGTSEYIERVAREKLGYMRPEEKVFIDAKKN
ncbi:MAG: hypothetical protein E7418_04515 [Ruminococcaceae bacterium]|nr:hypothetical protein [Oscillospiraceae bacterium]